MYRTATAPSPIPDSSVSQFIGDLLATIQPHLQSVAYENKPRPIYKGKAFLLVISHLLLGRPERLAGAFAGTQHVKDTLTNSAVDSSSWINHCVSSSCLLP